MERSPRKRPTSEPDDKRLSPPPSPKKPRSKYTGPFTATTTSGSSATTTTSLFPDAAARPPLPPAASRTGPEVRSRRAPESEGNLFANLLEEVSRAAQAKPAASRDAAPTAADAAARDSAAAALHERATKYLQQPKVQRWCRYEFFYSPIDAVIFRENEFQACLSEHGLGHLTTLSKAEWSAIRSLWAPRRFSARFLESERRKLEQRRRRIRFIQFNNGVVSTPDPEQLRDVPPFIPPKIVVGTTATIRVESPDIELRERARASGGYLPGQIIASDTLAGTYRVQFGNTACIRTIAETDIMLESPEELTAVVTADARSTALAAQPPLPVDQPALVLHHPARPPANIKVPVDEAEKHDRPREAAARDHPPTPTTPAAARSRITSLMRDAWLRDSPLPGASTGAPMPPLRTDLSRPEIITSMAALSKLLRVKSFLIDQLQKLNDEAEKAVSQEGPPRWEWSKSFRMQYAYVIVLIDYMNRPLAPAIAQIERTLRSYIDDGGEDEGPVPRAALDAVRQQAEQLFAAAVAAAADSARDPAQLLAEVRQAQGDAAAALTLLAAPAAAAHGPQLPQRSPTDSLIEQAIESARTRANSLITACLELLFLLKLCAEEDVDVQLQLDAVLAGIKPMVPANITVFRDLEMQIELIKTALRGNSLPGFLNAV